MSLHITEIFQVGLTPKDRGLHHLHSAHKKMLSIAPHIADFEMPLAR